MTRPEVVLEPVAFPDLAGWAGDDHVAAFEAFLKSARRLLSIAVSGEGYGGKPASGALLEAGRAALRLAQTGPSPATARSFFESGFMPHRIVHSGPSGLLTGYYEPVLEGARSRGGPFQVPIYRRPPDLVNMVAESQRGAMAHTLTHARKTATGTEPYATRAEIEGGALAGQGLELLWLEDPVDTFFLHIQGSGLIAFEDGSELRITYDGKNGHPYTSVGRYLIDQGLFPADRMSLEALKDWLKADPERGRQAMWQNKSFIFFRELVGEEAGSALGVLGIPLTPGRSLAVDAGYHEIGLPVFVSAPTLTHAESREGWQRLMIAQDVGSAIRGPERGDLYYGTGDGAGARAGVTIHPGRFFVLLPGPAGEPRTG